MSHLPVTAWPEEAREKIRKRSDSVDWFSRLPELSSAEWTYFLTMTFRDPIPRHLYMSAGSALTAWASRWETLSGNPGFKLLLWSAEEHMTGNVHVHALSVNTPEPLQRHCDTCLPSLRQTAEWRILKESWFIHHGIARVFPFKPELGFGAERYVTKYVLDEKCLDWGIEEW